MRPRCVITCRLLFERLSCTCGGRPADGTTVIGGATRGTGAAAVAVAGAIAAIAAIAAARSTRRRNGCRIAGSLRWMELAAPAPPRIGTAQKVANMIGVALPVVAFLVAVILLWNNVVDWLDLAIMVALYALSGFGVTVGYHRLLTHKS